MHTCSGFRSLHKRLKEALVNFIHFPRFLALRVPARVLQYFLPKININLSLCFDDSLVTRFIRIYREHVASSFFRHTYLAFVYVVKWPFKEHAR